MSFLALPIVQLLALAGVAGADLALYFLKLKRRPLEVPSTFLWARTVEDLHVNTIWQRLRRNLLLLLQLMLIALIMLTLTRPWRQGSQLSGKRFIFMVDVSASMQATDVSPSRFAEAKRTVLEYINQMESNDKAMVISFDESARIVQNYTDSRRQLRRSVEGLRPTNRGSNLSEALRAAAGLANPGSTRSEGAEDEQEALPATVYIFSDGAFESPREFDLGNLFPIHVKIGREQVDNVAVTAFSADRNPDQPSKLDIFFRLENSGPADTVVSVDLKLDGVVIDSKNAEVKAGEIKGDGFRRSDIDVGVFTLELSRRDALAVDNTAFAAVNRPRRAQVLLVTPGNPPLELALETVEIQKLAQITTVTPAYLEDEEYIRDAQLGVYDFILYDRCAPKTMPLANTLFWDATPPEAGWTVGEKIELPVIVDLDASHPLLQFVNFDNVLGFIEAAPVEGPVGARILVETTAGGVLAVAPRQGLEDAVFTLPLYRRGENGNPVPNTDWIRRQSFPVFVMNVIRYLGRVRGVTTAPNARPGEPVVIRTELPVDAITVTGPQKSRKTLRREGQNAFVFTDTEQPGSYAVREGDDDEVARWFTINLFDSRESNLEPREFRIGAEDVPTQQAAQVSRIEYWKWILLAALALLLFEWYVYNKRIFA